MSSSSSIQHANVFPLLQNTAVLSSAILITLVGMMLHIHFIKVDHESLLVIGSVGIQVSSSYASGRETTTFIEMGKIKDIVINEAIYMVNINIHIFFFVMFLNVCVLCHYNISASIISEYTLVIRVD